MSLFCQPASLPVLHRNPSHTVGSSPFFKPSKDMISHRAELSRAPRQTEGTLICEKKTKHTLIILILLCQAFAGGKIIILAGAQHKHCPLKVTGVFQESLISSFSSVNMFLPLQSHLCGQLVKTNSLGNVWHRG